MSELSPERREELAWEVNYGCGCYSERGLCTSCRVVFDRIAPLIAKWLDLTELLATEGSYAEGYEAGAAEVRARVEAVAAEWERDNEEHLDTWGQHLPASVGQMADILRAAMDGGE